MLRGLYSDTFVDVHDLHSSLLIVLVGIPC